MTKTGQCFITHDVLAVTVALWDVCLREVAEDATSYDREKRLALLE